jgi:hypothetical protein
MDKKTSNWGIFFAENPLGSGSAITAVNPIVLYKTLLNNPRN